VLQSLISGFPVLLLHFMVTAGMLVTGVLVYTAITPHHEFELVRAGNPAAAISLSGAILGLGIPLAFCLAASVARGPRSVEPGMLWAEVEREPSTNLPLGGISGGPVVNPDGAVIGIAIGASLRRGRVASAAPESVQAVLAQAGLDLPETEPRGPGAIEVDGSQLRGLRQRPAGAPERRQGPLLGSRDSSPSPTASLRASSGDGASLDCPRRSR
jgi:hypothetical protein